MNPNSPAILKNGTTVSPVHFQLIFALSLMFTALLPAGESFAETISKTVRAGYNSAVYNLAIYSRNACRGGIFPKLSNSKSKHGKITIKKIKHVIPKGKRCAGNTFYYAVIYYQPNRGFRGKDSAKFTLTFPKYTDGSGHSARTVKANLTVR